MSIRQYVCEKFRRDKPKIFTKTTDSDGNSNITGYTEIADAVLLPNCVRLIGVEGDIMKPDGELFGAHGKWRVWIERSSETVSETFYDPMTMPNDVLKGHQLDGGLYGSGGQFRRLKQERFCE